MRTCPRWPGRFSLRWDLRAVRGVPDRERHRRHRARPGRHRSVRRQKPDSQLPFPMKDPIQAEAFLSWAGHLGSALVPFAVRAVTKQKADLHAFLVEKAGSADLLGDIDGINLGAIYDERSRSRQTCGPIMARDRSAVSTTFLRMLWTVPVRGCSPWHRGTGQARPAGRLRAGNYIAMFSRAVVAKRRSDAKLSSSESFD